MTAPAEYRLAPGVVARMVGAALVLLAVLTFAGTVVVALTDLPAEPFVVLLLLVALGALGAGWYLRSRAWLVRCTETGYRVRLVRGVGVTEARWSAVEDAVTTVRHDVACLVLRLRDGRTTTIPVGLLDVDREQFVRDLQQRLQQGHGLRPWRPPAGSA